MVLIMFYKKTVFESFLICFEHLSRQKNFSPSCAIFKTKIEKKKCPKFLQIYFLTLPLNVVFITPYGRNQFRKPMNVVK